MEPIVDRAELDRQTFGDPGLLREIGQMFLAQAPPILAALEAAHGAARGEIAHRLKGSALALAARPLAEAAGRLEARPDDQALLDEVRRLCADTISTIGALVDK